MEGKKRKKKTWDPSRFVEITGLGVFPFPVQEDKGNVASPPSFPWKDFRILC